MNKQIIKNYENCYIEMISRYSQRDVFYLKFSNKIIESSAPGILQVDFHALFMYLANATLHKCLAYFALCTHTRSILRAPAPPK